MPLTLVRQRHFCGNRLQARPKRNTPSPADAAHPGLGVFFMGSEGQGHCSSV